MRGGPTVVLGGSGQLGTDLGLVWPSLRPDAELVSLSRLQGDVTDAASLRRTLEGLDPRAVVDLAAYHRVDDIEDDPLPAFQVNSAGAAHVAAVCRDLDIALLYLSTDYVFPGDVRRPLTEDDPVGPLSAYGMSKAAGETLVRQRCTRHFIVRSCGLYGHAGSSGKGGNFVETMLRLADEGREIKVVNDQVVTPTATRPLAAQICELLETEAYGTYHATCQGECTWYQFAAEIFEQAGKKPALRPQTSAEAGAKARRPAYSVLRNAGLQRLGIDHMPDWRVALAEYLASRS